ncbi:hypothetical protein D9613_001101 [Agrocybe pediades]|uniref:Uncharacterized protein n=1 Tax=Agrocybe pediades TaxID=84607 RepID=A0A8H4QZU5_9AGAR|nr:hypothetical protein D9613_001101 [Agrocybe pediades]
MVHFKGFRSLASRSHPTNLDSSTTQGRPSHDSLAPLLPTERKHSPTLGEATTQQNKVFGCVPLEVILSGNSRVADAIDSFAAGSQRYFVVARSHGDPFKKDRQNTAANEPEEAGDEGRQTAAGHATHFGNGAVG